MARPFLISRLTISIDTTSMDEYRDAKAQVFLNQKKEDFLVLNADDPEVMRLYDSRFSPQASRRGDKLQDSGLPDVYFFSRKRK